MDHGEEVFAHDPLANTVFGVQLYSENVSDVPNSLDQVKNFPHPVFVGACKFNEFLGESWANHHATTYREVWDGSFSRSTSCFYWAWDTDGLGNRMTTGSIDDLNDIGRYIVYDSPAALINTTKCDFILNAEPWGGGNGGPVDTTTTPVEQEPYLGENSQLPGTIQVEHYDVGGLNVAYYDTDASNQGGATLRNDGVDLNDQGDGNFTLGYNQTGEWLEYTVDIPNGTYVITFPASTVEEGKQLTIKLGDGDTDASQFETLATVDLPNTGGWGAFQTVVVQDVEVTNGGTDKILRLETTSGYFDLDWIAFEAGPTRADGFASGMASASGITLAVSGSHLVLPTLTRTSATLPVLSVFDTAGRRVYSVRIHPDTQRVTKELKSGMYVVHLTNGQDRVRGTLLVR